MVKITKVVIFYIVKKGVQFYSIRLVLQDVYYKILLVNNQFYKSEKTSSAFRIAASILKYL